ncbi:uncharacterized protein LOC118466056 [Anopheles albimanus]|uniref:C2H2-type domain-containing protein n=1 Tax=Anopheles albimanus TaxID=7167 RepID=A0A182FUG7_ANOAL|nr:uncharacterized protein LOC118466056 [Anopheles albimanus]
MATTATEPIMATLNTPKRLKTMVPQCHNYLSTPPPPSSSSLSAMGIGSPPLDSLSFGNLDAVASATPKAPHHHQQQQQQPQQLWNNSSSWLSEATSPSSSCGSPDGLLNRSFNGGHNGATGTPKTWSSSGGGSAEKSENKRGRPRSEALTTLMVEGSISPSAIKCRYCNRVFPREKSLQAHLRTHTGERPYHCDYPGCTRAFTQSGQLKTHQRLHTGERPFICAAARCQMRFTHANRHCPDHPYETLKRCDDFVIQTVPEQNGEVLKWLEKYRAEREDRTPTRKTPKRNSNRGGGGGNAMTGSAGSNRGTNNENENQRPSAMQRPMDNDENRHHHGGPVGYCPDGAGGGMGVDQSPITPNNTYKSSRKGLMCELDMNAGRGLVASPVTTKTKTSTRPKLIQWQEPTLMPSGHEEDEEEGSGDDDGSCAPAQSTFNPKKKWLREAWQDDLAKPLEPSVISQKVFASTTSTMALKQQLHQESSSKHSPVKRASFGQQPGTGQGRQHLQPLSRSSATGGLPVPVLTTVAPVPTVPPLPVPVIDPNQMRPTVLMVASKDCARPLCDQPAALLTNGQRSVATGAPKPEENNRKLQGALALMQLATEDAQVGAVTVGERCNSTFAGEEELLNGSETLGYGYPDGVSGNVAVATVVELPDKEPAFHSSPRCNVSDTNGGHDVYER